MKYAVIISLLALAACAQPEPIREKLPVQIATCPDPEERERLLEGSTFRDLARARVEALGGWEQCFNAARENGNALK